MPHLMDAAAQARAGAGVDARTLAVITGRAIDAVVAEGLHDPTFPTRPAATELRA
ncbi:hypothetical protein ABZ802_24840 [Streptomyces sp. NPDC047737]|uniref:hypothetical protein n=1 Tax=unclassified Streptomyces TaxID=2593676 RepID=UPI0033EF7890